MANSNIVAVHYRVGHKIGEGSFGIIFEGVNLLDNTPVAIKFESRKGDAPQLKDEFKAYRVLAQTEGIPQCYYYGHHGSTHNILVIDLLGPSLEDLFDWCRRRFSPKTVCLLAKQMIRRVQAIHEHDLIYRDIKPDNFLVGNPLQPLRDVLFVVDFGMAKQFRDPRTRQHIPYKEKKPLSGTARYMSINTHLGIEQSRRDDLESLGHVFFYFLRGSLPWQGLKANTNKQKYEKIGEKKLSTPVADLCAGLPSQFADYLTLVRGLRFEETPDYDHLVRLMDEALALQGEIDDGYYDWMGLNSGRGWDLALNKKPNLHGYGNPDPPPPRAEKSRHQAPQVYAKPPGNHPGSNHPETRSESYPSREGVGTTRALRSYKDSPSSAHYGSTAVVPRVSGFYQNEEQGMREGDKRSFWDKLFCCCRG